MENVENHLKLATFLATIMDNQFNILGFRFGMSAFIDLLPGIGDIIDVIVAMYIVWIALQLELPVHRIVHMIANIIFTFVVGLIPVVGDAGYLLYRPNLKNLTIIKQHLSRQTEQKKLHSFS